MWMRIVLRCAVVIGFGLVVQAQIAPRVLIIGFYSSEQDVWWGIPEFNLLEKNITVPGLSMKFPDVHCTNDGSVYQLVAGEGEINAATSTLALVLSSDFDLTKTYLLAGVAGISPEVGTLASVTFAQLAVQVALQYEFDARDVPEDWATGYVPQGTTSVDSYPRYIYGTEVFQLNDALRQRAIAFAKTAALNDSADARAYRQLYANVPESAPALASPSVIGCDTATSDNWWSGELLGRAFENYTKLVTNGTATYCTTQQEDNAVLEALLRGQLARRVDFSRVMILRTASDFDRPPPGVSAPDHLFHGLQGETPALRNIYLAGVKVVQGILDEWDDTFAAGVPAQSYVGDVYGSLGGSPGFGPGSIFEGKGAAETQDTVTKAATPSTAEHAWSTACSFVLRLVLGLGIWLGAWLFALWHEGSDRQGFRRLSARST